MNTRRNKNPVNQPVRGEVMSGLQVSLFEPHRFKKRAIRGTMPRNKNGNNAFLDRLSKFSKARLNNPPFTMISLFCGGGGLDLGLSFAGFGSRLASDVTPVFVETVTANIPHSKPLVIDAMKATGALLLERAGLDKVDLIAAGPPCQSFSVLGRRGALDDPRGKLALKYFELIAEVKPRAFLFENVPGLLSVNDGEDWRILLKHAEKVTGYHLYWTRLNALTFGIPQARERIVLVGFKEKTSFEFPKAPSGPGAIRLLEEGGGQTPSLWALENVDNLPNQKVREHGSKVRKRYENTPPGQRDRTDHTDRIHPNRPAGTVLVGSSAGGGRPHIHPIEPRVITVREGARLQSFPDWYTFKGTSTAQYRQIGNAVPPLLAYEVGVAIRRALEG